jgi:cyclopropane fatty-acyl-phospholipid synthase-like methyltransferase
MTRVLFRTGIFSSENGRDPSSNLGRGVFIKFKNSQPNASFMELTDYLTREGLRDFSSLNWDSVKSVLTEEQLRVHDNLAEQFYRLNVQENIARFYDHAVGEGIDLPHESLYWNRTLSSSPLILAELKGSNSVLDIGCNSGLKTVFYAMNMPDTRFTGIDLSNVSIEKARERAQKYGCKNIRFENGDMTEMEFDKEFDAVLSENSLFETHCIYYSFKREEHPMFFQKFERCYKALKKGKFVVFITPGDFDEIKDLFLDISKGMGFSNPRVKSVDFLLEGEKSRSILFTAEK